MNWKTTEDDRPNLTSHKKSKDIQGIIWIDINRNTEGK